MRTNWLAIFLFILAPTTCLSDVYVVPERATDSAHKVPIRIYIEGSITSKDATDLAELFVVLDSKFKKWAAFVFLDATGGSLAAAMKIGSLLRQREAIATVGPSAKCLSACVYVLAGAPIRAVYDAAVVGVHRPYDPNDTVDSPAQQQEKQRQIGKTAREYLRAMNIPERLYDDAQFISPDRMKILSRAELQQYGLSADDPSVEEANEVREAQRLGITRAELGRRKADGRRRCGLDRMTDSTPIDALGKAMVCYEQYVKLGK